MFFLFLEIATRVLRNRVFSMIHVKTCLPGFANGKSPDVRLEKLGFLMAGVGRDWVSEGVWHYRA